MVARFMNATATFPAIASLMREPVVAFYGLRALMVQACHPLVYAGLLAHTAVDIHDSRAAYRRLAKTVKVVDQVIWEPATAREATSTARRAHAHARGVLTEAVGRWPAGSTYVADSPELLLWVLASLADSAIATHRHLVGPLSVERVEAAYQEFRRFGEHFDLPLGASPATWNDLQEYLVASRDALGMTPETAATVDRIVLGYPLPAPFTPAGRVTRLYLIGSLPPDLRDLYGFSFETLDAGRWARLTGCSRTLHRLTPRRLRFPANAWLLSRAAPGVYADYDPVGVRSRRERRPAG